MKRTQFFLNQLSYVLSLDLPLDDDATAASYGAEGEGPSTKAPVARRRTHAWGDPKPGGNGARVYNALAERRVLNEEPISGRLRVLDERLNLVPDQQMGQIDGRMLIETDDGVVIEASYSGVVRAGARWHWIAEGASPHAASRSNGPPIIAGAVDMKAFITARFDCGHTKYKWLVKYQCVGYGRLQVLWATPRWGTFDVYAMTGDA